MSRSDRTALVIGAGIMGLSAARSLASAGWQVRVLEQDQVPSPRASSHDQHRLIRHAYGAEAGYQAMVDAAFDAWDGLWAELRETLYVPTGVLAMAGPTPRRGPPGWLAESRATLLAAGHALKELAPAELPGFFPMLSPQGLGSAFYMEAGGVLLAERILVAMHRRCMALGVEFEVGQALWLEAEKGQVRLAGGATRSADIVVVAAGPWLGRLIPWFDQLVRPSRQIVVMLEPPPALRPAWEAAPMLLDLDDSGGFYAVPPVAGTSLKIGDHKFSRIGSPEDTRAALPTEISAILDLARRRLPGLDQYRVLGGRACYYDVTEAERFILQPWGKRAWVMSGFSGHGFKFGPLLGQALVRALGNPALAPGVANWAAGLAPPPAGLLSSGP